jgi:WD40 repeat protein
MERLSSKNVYHMYQLAHSSDKCVLASLGYNLFACRRDQGNAWRELFLMRWKDPYGGVAISPNGKTLFAANSHDGKDFEIRRFDLTAAKKKELKKWPVPARLRKLAFSPDGRWLAAAGQAKCYFILNPEMGEVVANPETDDWISDIQFSPDGSLLATVVEAGARLWKAGDWTPLCDLHMPSARLDFSPNGRFLALCSSKEAGFDDSSTLAVGEVASGNVDCRIRRDETVKCAAFSPDGRHIAVGGGILGRSSTARLAALHRKIRGLAADDEAGSPPADFTPRATDKATLTLFDAATGKEKSRLICGFNAYDDVGFLDDNHVLFVGMDNDGSAPIGVWNLPI